jgi:cation transport ATPase
VSLPQEHRQDDNVAADESHKSNNPPIIDPVCGMQVTADPDKSLVHLGVTYHFCSQHCITKFKAEPDHYLHPDKTSKTPQSAIKKDVIYTCPMHPEIQQVGPGVCPKCGMTLEPMNASVTEDTTELRDMTRRFWVSLVLTLPLLVLTMSDFISGVNLPQRFGVNTFNWIQLILATPVVLWGGWPFLVRAWASFKTWNLNMFSLIGLGISAAFLFSVFALFFPTLLPDTFKMHGIAPLYFEAAAVIVTLVLMGQVLELRARSRTNSAIKSLLELAPNTAFRVQADGTVSISVQNYPDIWGKQRPNLTTPESM